MPKSNAHFSKSIFIAVLALCAGSFALSAASVQSAPPSVTYLFPAGAAQGQTIEIQAGGSFPQWPVEVWVNADGLEVKAAEKKGRFQVAVHESAPCGRYWLRFYDGQGASALRPFLVGAIAEINETEPNEQASELAVIAENCVINGRLQKRGDVDSFRVQLKQGETLVSSLEANQRLASPMDAVMQIASPDGFVYQQNHDARGLDPTIAFTAPNDGEYVIRLFAFPSKPNSTIGFAGADDYVYRLTLSTGPVLSHTLPLVVEAGKVTDLKLVGWNLTNELATGKVEPKEGTGVSFWAPNLAVDFSLPVVEANVVSAVEKTSLKTPQQLEPSMVISGTIAEADEIDTFRFSTKKGDQRTIRVVSDALGFLLDPVVKITDATGKTISETDDVSKERDPIVTFKSPADGDYDISVFDLYRRGGQRFAYMLDFEEATPDFRLTVKTDIFAAQAGEAVEVEVAIERLNKFTEPISISAIDAPAGWTAESVKSTDKADTAKSVKLKFTAGENAVSGPVQIEGRSGDRVRFATYEAVGIPHRHAWLNVTKSTE